MRGKIAHPPKIFLVNWFRKDGSGKFIWPGAHARRARACRAVS